jgi:hypothetical protein
MSWRRIVGVAFALAALAGLLYCAFLLYVCLRFRGWFDDPKDGFRTASDAAVHGARWRLVPALHRAVRHVAGRLAATSPVHCAPPAA